MYYNNSRKNGQRLPNLSNTNNGNTNGKQTMINVIRQLPRIIQPAVGVTNKNLLKQQQIARQQEAGVKREDEKENTEEINKKIATFKHLSKECIEDPNHPIHVSLEDGQGGCFIKIVDFEYLKNLENEITGLIEQQRQLGF